MMKEKMKHLLLHREKQVIDDPERMASAVLVPLYKKEGAWHVMLIKRSNTVRAHKGEISFPGGKKDESDKDFRETALREGFEEIGLDPGEVEILGELDEEATLTSNFTVHAFLALIPYPYPFAISEDEVDSLVEIPLAALLDKSNFKEEPDGSDGQNVMLYYYYYQDTVIFGATARILKKLFDLMKDHGFLSSRSRLSS